MTKATDSPPAFLYASDFFKTNRIFTDGDQKLIRQHLDYAEANLLHVQRLTHDVVDKDRNQDLTRQESELVDCIERCRVALAPIKKLPDDVLRRIFIIYCDKPTQFLSRNLNPFLITLCQVCSGWRGLAIETPFLWSQINLSSYRPHSYSRDHDLLVEKAVKLWFTRASTCPISFEANVRPYYSTVQAVQGRELRDLVERIIALPCRYRKLVLTFPRKEIDLFLGKLSPDQLWHLEELEIVDVNKIVDAECLNPSFSPDTTLPSLRKLMVIGYWNPNNLSSLLPFPRLQRLDIQTTMSLALELFQQCPLLETCEIVIRRSDSIIRSRLANRTSYITHTQLRDLYVWSDSTEDCCRLIDQLVLSNLQFLKIFASHGTVFRPNEMEEHVVALSQRSGTPNIRGLDLNRKLVPILNPGLLLRSLPHLERISMDGCATLDEETLDGLAMGTIGRYLRNLHTDEIEANLAALTKMAKQRAQNVGLNKLCITTSKGVLDGSGWNDR